MADMQWVRQGVVFVCDGSKRALNLRKHRIDLIKASAVFFDPFAELFFDVEHSEKEDRYGIVGKMDNEILVCVACTLRGKIVRVISARKATKREAKRYAEK